MAVRDGIHGLAVWGAAVLLGAFLLGASAETAVKVTAESAATVASVAQQTASDIVQAGLDAVEDNDVSAAEVKAAAETARKYSVISAFVLAASLMIAGAGAYWAACTGGQHRDEGRVFARFGRWT